MLTQEEQIEQAFFFKSLRERLGDSVAMQELLPALREETLITTKLPMAIDFLMSELIHQGVMAPAMQPAQPLLHAVSNVCCCGSRKGTWAFRLSSRT